MKILAIETSADDTGIAILEAKELKNSISFKILANVVNTQDIHNKYGGIFPMMAKREHAKNIEPLFKKAMQDAKNPKIDAVAVTVGPGLEPTLWVGIDFAEKLSKEWDVPIIPVNHMEGHLLSVFPNKTKKFTVKIDKKMFPVLSLLISGGHTQIVLMESWMKYKLIGETRDDAAGEAFDKVARMLGLPYPGGPAVSKLASLQRKASKVSDISFPRPMLHSKDYDFSFSGLKTAVLYYIRDNGPINDEMKSKIAREFEDAVIEVLVSKTLRAVKQYKIKTLTIGGGVSANTYLQKNLKSNLKKIAPKTTIHFPVPKLSTDNALMIAIAGYFNYRDSKLKKNSHQLKANGNLSM